MACSGWRRWHVDCRSEAFVFSVVAVLPAGAVARLAADAGQRVGCGSIHKTAFFAETDRVATDAIRVRTLSNCFESFQGTGVKRIRPFLVNTAMALRTAFRTDIFACQSRIAGRSRIVVIVVGVVIIIVVIVGSDDGAATVAGQPQSGT